MSADSVEPRETEKFFPRSHAIFVAFKKKSRPAPGYITKTTAREPDLLDDRQWTSLLTHEQTSHRMIKMLAGLLKCDANSFFYPHASTPDHADQAIHALRENRSRKIEADKNEAMKSGTDYNPNKHPAKLEEHLKAHINPDDNNLHAPVVYESLRKPDQWDARRSSLLNNRENLTEEDQKDLLAFIRHIDAAFDEEKNRPAPKPAGGVNKTGTTITEPEQIIQAAYQYVQTQGDSAKDALKKLLKGVFKDPEIKSNELVDLILKHPGAPHEPLKVIQKNVLTKIQSGEKFDSAERKAIIRFCDFATCIALPERELFEIQRQIDESLALIQVDTQDRPLIILHFARLLPTSDYQAESRQDPRRILDQIAHRQLIPKNLQEISVPAEGGAGAAATTSYQNQFIGGLAIQLGIPVFDPDSPQAIAAATGQIQAHLRDWVDPDIAIRIAVFVEENRDHDISKLKKLFPEIFFIKLPEIFTTDSYHLITTRRNTITAAIHSDRESH